ncbi:MAG: hypothetical protein KatS3mg031_1885 [Chitinophagales bacterium]|nr:MAG: hypothetical protein KatS3mg031_1885 [Chitinophagales bacterium]
MFRYVLKRLLIFIPTLFVISVFTFALSKVAPGDPVELRLAGGMQSQSGGQLAEKLAGERAYIELSEKMGLNLPAFYFSITSAAYPDTLYKIHRKGERETLSRLIDRYGNWQQISDYYHSIKTLEYALFNIPRDSTTFEGLRLIRESANELYRQYDDAAIMRLIARIDSGVNIQVQAKQDSIIRIIRPLASLQPLAGKIAENYALVKSKATPAKKYIPTIHFYGLKNQYHRWLFGDAPWFGENTNPAATRKGFFRGDFGESYLDGRPVSSILIEAVKWTMLLNIISVLLAYLIAIPIGVETAVKKDSLFDRVATTLLFILYSLPSFWIATMLIVFLTTPEYGMDFFPTYGTGSVNLPEDASFMARVWDTAYHLTLPVFCLTYGSFAYISRQMRGGMLNVIRQDYIRTAQAKGLSRTIVIWKHAFKNSLLPIITMFASLFPLMISGSVILEVIFAIPGMGRVAYESVVARNYPVLYTVFMLSAILTMAGILVADLLYAAVDPRISFSKKKG